MEKQSQSMQNNNISKIKGIYYNYNKSYNEELYKESLKIFQKLNYISLGIIGQSIHHINFLSDNDDVLEKIVIGYRKLGIKPEDIDGLFLEKKKEKDGLSDYEQLLYGIWTYHYKNNQSYDEKTIKKIMKELNKLKCQWSGKSYIPFKDLPIEEKEQLEEECTKILKNIIKY